MSIFNLLIMKKYLTIIGCIFLLFSCKNKPSTKAIAEPYQLQQTIFFNGDILTMQGKEPTYAEAVVQREGKIIFVGSKAEAFKQFEGKAAQYNLEGKTLLPAFVDGHGHMYNVGFVSLCANLLAPPDGPGKDIESIVNTLNAFKTSEDGQYLISKLGWITGNGYDDSQLKEGTHPTAKDLDKVSTDYPVVIVHQSGHLGVINSKAIEMMGYNAKTKNPEGGNIRRDKDGKPNGVLEEAALFNVLFPILGKTDADFARKIIDKAQVEYAKNGYLTVQDGRTTVEQLKVLKIAADSNLFYVDVVAYPDITLGTDYMKEAQYSPSHQYKNRFRVGGVKLTLDGSPQGKTAWLTQCYHVNPEGRDGCYKGYPIMDDNKATEYVEKAFKNKWQILCHCNGDASIDQYINAVDVAEKLYDYTDHRTVLVHGQTLRKDQIPELVRLHMMPSLFPMHTFYWGDWHVASVLGEPRADYISPCRDVIDAGLIITSHHDAPVTFPNSMRVMDATVNRVTRSGKILGPDQRITPYEGLEALTSWAAYQYFEENRKGSIEVGKLADFVILDKNPLKIDPLEIHNINILESIKEGKTIYKKQ